MEYRHVFLFIFFYLDKGKSDYQKPRRPCLFCFKMPKTQYKRHVLTHKNEERVKVLNHLPKKEVDLAIDLMRKEAIRVHNIKCLNEGTQNFQRERTPKGYNNPIMCTGCCGFYEKGYKSRHQTNCPVKTSKNIMLPMVSMENHFFDNYEDDFKELLNSMHMDHVADTAKTDEIILMIGRRFFNSIKRKKDKKTECLKYVRSRMRLTARLYLSFKTVLGTESENRPAGLQNNAADMFRRETITLFGEAVNVLCTKERGGDDDDAEDLQTAGCTITGQKSSLKISILNLVKSNAQLLMGHFLMHNQDKQKDQVVDFLQVLKLVENELFGDAYYDVNYRNNVNKKKAKSLPTEEDIQLLIAECEDVMKTADVMDINSTNFVAVRAATSTFLVIFNARRGGEPMRLLKSQWCEAF